MLRNISDTLEFTVDDRSRLRRIYQEGSCNNLSHFWLSLSIVLFTIDQRKECLSRFRDELLNRELFLSVDELKYVADRWRMDYNHYRPHSSLDYMAPAAFATICLEQGPGSLRLTQDKENCCELLS